MNNRNSYFPLILIVSLVSGCTSNSLRKMEVEWDVKSNQIIEQLEESKDGVQGSTMPKPYTYANLAMAYDIYLYMEFMEILQESTVFERSTLINQQRAWVSSRNTEVRQVYDENNGGTIASVLAAERKIELTKGRLEEIQMLKNQIIQRNEEQRKFRRRAGARR